MNLFIPLIMLAAVVIAAAEFYVSKRSSQRKYGQIIKQLQASWSAKSYGDRWNPQTWEYFLVVKDDPDLCRGDGEGI